MELGTFLKKLSTEPESIEFTESIATIEQNYGYTPTAFTNGDVTNKAGQNEGSCKILAFAYINNFTVTETLNCFGKYYRDDVLGNPAGNDHQNIRQFILDGFEGVKFNVLPLQFKS
jgi:type III HopJ-like effector protein